ncbi:hypothetical protein CWB59_12720 [Pseudoalteromonas sp. S326]|uniref:hypothetical protein n=1 Tax=Pseudoalteromonas sp. S326 TaxID=579533 RepID=UPI00110B603F|nr:hypothetical protein [Pseudoalteromonas sp. S326]TMO16773.1 hypothetical protein CWB59_12720 [Pseudoalteromonas sp. S326]
MRLHISKIKLPEKETHYRYRDHHYENGLIVSLNKFYSVRETESCHYVVGEWEFKLMKRWDFEKLSKCGDKFITVKRVVKGALRTYCNEDKQLALKSFLARKRSQLLHAETAKSKATLALGKVSGMSAEEVGESLNCGLDEHLESFVFD